MNYLIGVDLGTQGTKTTLCREDCAVAAEAFEESRLLSPEPGAVEQDPEEMLASILNTIKEVLQKSGIKPADVACVGVDGQMAGTMGVDKTGMASTPYDSWLDVRCGKYRDEILAFGEERLIEITGAPFSYAHGPKVLWLKGERPEAYAKTHKFVPPAAYCVMRMCGLSGEEAFIDHTYLHFTGFADTQRARWSRELLEAYGVAAEKMPRIVKPHDIVGRLTAEMAARCGLKEGTPMVAGCGDTAASSFGAGVVRKGLLFDVAGTASVFACATDEYAPDTANKTIMFPRAVAEGLYTPMAYINGGGLCLKWFRDDVLGKARSYAELDAAAEQVEPGSGNLLFVPHFHGRVCPNDPLVRGSFINLSRGCGWQQMYRAVLEGIAYEYRLYADIIHRLMPELAFERVICVGGGAASPVFRKIKADILGTPVSTINRADTAAIACCVIAGHAVGLYDSLTGQIEKIVSRREETAPDPALFDFYTGRVRAYSETFNALHGVYARLLEL
jgi:xylulokinase